MPAAVARLVPSSISLVLKPQGNAAATWRRPWSGCPHASELTSAPTAAHCLRRCASSPTLPIACIVAGCETHMHVPTAVNCTVPMMGG